ncbi:MAG: energy transducer TonB [Methyloglobulus sp.]|nr:energy transducer TonB [Methyloglobulus sp.]
MNTVTYSNSLGQCSSVGKEVSYRDVWLAIAGSALLHTLIATYWQPSEVEPLIVKPPQVMEVELVTPPPEVKPVEPIKPKPVVKKKAVQQAKPKPATPKAPPKVLQKTVTEAAPEVKAIKPVYAPVPVFAKPVNKPSNTAMDSSLSGKTGTAKATPRAQNSPGGASSGVVALVRVKPKYPARALTRHLEGQVTIQFTVDTAGHVENPAVTSAMPSGVFEEAALAAIKQWKFKQKIVNGSPVSQRAVQTLKFKLDS